MAMSLKFNTALQFERGVPDVMGAGVLRLVAPNGGPLTFKGTNTYIVGETDLAVIDPGPDDVRHRQAILDIAAGRRITHIVTTHAHRDHVDGLPALQDATGACTYGYCRTHIPVGGAGDRDAEYVGHDYAPDVHLEHGALIEGEGWQLEALHTPGHAPDHLCFALRGGGLLFSGDHVMAWNTSVIAPPEGRMADYLQSLELLLDRDEVFLPGHGGQIDRPQRTVKAYLLHRKWREQAILEAIRGGTTSVRALLPMIYRDLSPEVAGAALLSLRAHVDHLAERGLVTCADSANGDCEAVPL